MTESRSHPLRRRCAVRTLVAPAMVAGAMLLSRYPPRGWSVVAPGRAAAAGAGAGRYDEATARSWPFLMNFVVPVVLSIAAIDGTTSFGIMQALFDERR